jgi:hypothetical protein
VRSTETNFYLQVEADVYQVTLDLPDMLFVPKIKVAASEVS